MSTRTTPEEEDLAEEGVVVGADTALTTSNLREVRRGVGVGRRRRRRSGSGEEWRRGVEWGSGGGGDGGMERVEEMALADTMARQEASERELSIWWGV